jgi:methionine-rich copper-binding protein CopC
MRSRRVALLGFLLGIACVATLAGAQQALAHAQLLGTAPTSSSTVAVQPTEVIFKFNQAVGGTLGAVRV